MDSIAPMAFWFLVIICLMFAFRLAQRKFQNKVRNKSWPFGTKFDNKFSLHTEDPIEVTRKLHTHAEFKINDKCPRLGTVSIVSNKQSIYTGVILIVRGSLWQAPGRPLLPVCPSQCRGQCDGLSQSLATRGWAGLSRQLRQCQPPVGPQHPTWPHLHQWHRAVSDGVRQRNIRRLSYNGHIILVLRLWNSYTLWLKLWPGGFFVEFGEWESKQFWSHDPLPPTQLVTAPSHCHCTV